MKTDMFTMMKKTSSKTKNLIESLGLTFIRINPDVKTFDLDVKISRMYNHIQESSVKLAINSA